MNMSNEYDLLLKRKCNNDFEIIEISVASN